MTQAADHRMLSVPEGLSGERVDAALARMFGLSRTRAAELIGQGHVLLDGADVGKSDRVFPGAVIDITIPVLTDPLVVVPEIVEGIKIIHDDPSIVVIDKPVGVAVHPSPGWSGPTVVGHLAGAGFRIATSGASERQGIVQRLDVGTSGVMVICKSEIAYSRLKNAFRHRTVDKTYHALVQGHPDPLEGTIDAPIGRHPKADYKFAVMADGRHSITHYETLEAHRFASLLEVHLETGRTHQIRVHMAALKHPCVGRPDVRRGPGPGPTGRAHTAVAARRTPRLRAPGLRRARRVRVDLPRRPGQRARGRPRGPLMDEWQLRAATAEDLPALADLYLRVRVAAIPAMPPGIHSDDEVRGWVGGWDLEQWDVWLAETPERCAAGVRGPDRGLAALALRRSRDCRPRGRQSAAGSGQDAAARRVLPLGLREQHPGAFVLRPPRAGRPGTHRRIDERGEVARHQDGLAGGRPAVEFFRGLIDDVDGQLGDLLARRVALTRAVQAHKPDAARDHRARAGDRAGHGRARPRAGGGAAGRIVGAIIRESLDAAGER